MTVFSPILAALSKERRYLEAMCDPLNEELFTGIISFEKILTNGFSKYELDLGRAAFLPEIFRMLFSKSRWPKLSLNELLEIATIVTKDLKYIKPLLDDLKGTTSFIPNDSSFRFFLDGKSKEEIFKNYHIGLGKSFHRYYVFLRYVHNVHTFKYVIQKIYNIVPDTLKKHMDEADEFSVRMAVEDNMLDEIRTIPDVTAYLQNVLLKKDGVSIFDPYNIPEIPVTFDSKFLSQDSLRNTKTIRQQLKQNLGARSGILADSFKYLESIGKSNDEIVELFGTFIPEIFQHYVMLPKNFVPGTSPNAKFAEEAKLLMKPILKLDLEATGIMEGSTAYNRFLRIMDDFIDDHYGTGKFLLNSDMNHPWLQ